MIKNPTNKTDVRKILPYGAIKEIAARSKTSIKTVSRVVNEGANNQDVKKILKEYLQEMNNNDNEIRLLVTERKTFC